MLSSNLLFSVCETLGGGYTFITFNDKSAENELGTIGALMDEMSYQLTAGNLRINSCYVLSNIPLYEAMPSVIFSSRTNGGKTSMFGYLMDELPTQFVV